MGEAAVAVEHARGVLRADDHRWRCRSIVEVSSSSFDPDRAGVGSSPYIGDMGSSSVRVPTAPTTSQSNRYLIRLCGVQVPSGCGIILHGLRQAATIRAEQVDELRCDRRAFELRIRDPFWTFPDGNISWHLRLVPSTIAPAVYDANQQPGTDPNLNQLDSALLYQPPLTPYTAPNAGIPPGAWVDWLGSWYDLRYPWSSTEWRLHQVIRGPMNLIFFASVAQTDPTDRLVLPVADVGALEKEDRFVQQFPDAIYGRVAGSLVVELLPNCTVPL